MGSEHDVRSGQARAWYDVSGNERGCAMVEGKVYAQIHLTLLYLAPA